MRVRPLIIKYFYTTTTFDKYEKLTRQVKKPVTAGGPILGPIRGKDVTGYEIHMGMTTPGDTAFGDDGCINPACTVIGTYLHGLFENEHLVAALLRFACEKKDIPYVPGAARTDPYDELAELIKANLDVEKLLAIIERDQS